VFGYSGGQYVQLDVEALRRLAQNLASRPVPDAFELELVRP
jgi:hypothetical protein